MPALPAVVRDRGSQENFDALNSRTTALETLKAWTAPTFQNSWENYEAAGTYATAAYRKGPDGRVTVRGLVKHAAATGTSTIFTLPAGFRPSKNLIFPAWSQMGGTIQTIRVDVTSGGEVLVFAPAEATTYLSINLSFYPD